jgi:bifunctional non-homologous end joining protein LigD
VIAKVEDAPYRGSRNRDWVKIKCERRQEFVICGFTAPGGSRSHFGALLCAYHDEEGNLRYAGKVGTGYDEKTLEEVHGKLRQRVRKTSPLDEEIPRSETRDVTWVTPKFVAEICFTEMTSDNRLRHPVFHGLREDKEPESVVLEQSKPAPNNSKEQRKQGQDPPKSSSKSSSNQTSNSKGSQKNSRGEVGRVSISNPDREVFPSANITKLELAEYFSRIAEHMLPFLANRPLSLVRCPRGREEKCFFQKHFADAVPEFVHITKIEEKKGRAPYSYVDDADGLVSLAQWGVIEFHPWGSRVDRTDRPDVLIFDLDPNPDVKWEEVLGATFLVRDILENELDLQTFVKTSGGKGLHVYVPIQRYSGWEEAREFTKNVSEAVKRRNPDKFVTVSTKAKREGKIFIDYLRNGRGATSVAPFSPRARECAPVSVPIGRHEISPDLRADQYTLENIFKRLGALKEDPWKDFFDVKQRISKSLLEKVKTL